MFNRQIYLPMNRSVSVDEENELSSLEESSRYSALQRSLSEYVSKTSQYEREKVMLLRSQEYSPSLQEELGETMSNSNMFKLNEQNQNLRQETAGRSLVLQSEQQDTQGPEWQVSQSRKKKRGSTRSSNSPERRVRPRNVSFSSDLIQIENRYAPLETEAQDKTENEQIVQKLVVKPPPIFIPDISNITPLLSIINSNIEKQEYSYTLLKSNQMKLSTHTIEAYRKIKKALDDKHVQCHTYQLKSERAYRVVLRNMHYTSDTEMIKSELLTDGHEVRNITNVLHRQTKEPLSMFFIDLEPKANNKAIYKIEYLLNARVHFEPPNKRRPDIVQCKRCQRYGHSQKYCTRKFRCVKCGDDHDTRTCIKPKETSAKCALCDGDHPASYKGCIVYREITRRKFPTIREKREPKVQPATVVSYSHRENASTVSSGISYAQVVRSHNRNGLQSENDDKDNNNQNINNETTTNSPSTLTRLEQLLIKQAEDHAQLREDIRNLINLLTAVVAKLK